MADEDNPAPVKRGRGRPRKGTGKAFDPPVAEKPPFVRPHGNGAGWGGIAKGHTPQQKAPFLPGNTFGKRPPDPAKIEIRKQRAFEMECVLEELAYTAVHEMTRMNAAAKLHSIDAGLPVARVEAKISHGVEELSDEELLEIAKSSGSS